MKIILNIITLFVEIILSFLEVCLRIPQLLLQQVAAGMAQRLQLIRTAIRVLQDKIEKYRKTPVKEQEPTDRSVELALPDPFNNSEGRTIELRRADKFVVGCLVLLLISCCGIFIIIMVFILLNSRG
jgi:hypothetical protein